jgi:UDP-glucose 4-epimerase
MEPANWLRKKCASFTTDLYGMRNICLRYFNVYGLNQRYDAYGNVIPIFANRIMQRKPLTIYGDGEQTRDFVNVNDVVAANLQAALAQSAAGVFNIAGGARMTINSLATLMREISGIDVGMSYVNSRPGDVLDSLADIRAAHKAFGFIPAIAIRDGLAEYLDWIRLDSISNEQMKRPL